MKDRAIDIDDMFFQTQNLEDEEAGIPTELDIHVDITGEEVSNAGDTDVGLPSSDTEFADEANAEIIQCTPDLLEEEDSDVERPCRGPRRILDSSDEESIEVEKQVNTVQDELQRPHVRTSRTGEGYIFLASSQMDPSTSTAHANDLLNIFEHNPELKKKVVTIVCDDGNKFPSKSFFYVMIFQATTMVFARNPPIITLEGSLEKPN